MSAALATVPSKKFTPDDLLHLPGGGKGFELVDGELKELNVSYLSSFVAGRIHARLSPFVEANHLGWMSSEGTSFACFPAAPARVRRADAAFIALDRFTREQALAEGHCTVVPDLVVEVVSPNDIADEVNTKRIEWQTAGAVLVWIVHPVHQTIHAYRQDGTVRLFQQNDVLDAEPVLPGFRVPMAELFRLPV